MATLPAPRNSVLWGGAAFALGNALFLLNKLDEMSRLFLGRRMPDVISGQTPVSVLVGQVALAVGFVAHYRFYSPRLGPAGKNALRLFSGGGLALTFGHFSFLSPTFDPLFLCVVVGLFLMLIGLIWFGALNLRRPVLGRWRWLPFATGLLGFIGFVLVRGQEVTITFLVFRTLFSLGLVGMGVLLSMEERER